MRIIVIGGGPAGMAAAVTAREHGVEEVLLLERHSYLGGVLPQCIHNGFGLQLYEKDYTGGEYAFIWEQKTWNAGVDIRLDTTVLSVEPGWEIRCVSGKHGAEILTADAVIMATGCRERTLAQLHIPGSRPAGIYTAGSAQLMINRKNYLPGKSAVILGSGDIGLIMARRMTLEGIKVKLIIGQESTGLARNIVQCVKDFNIPMKYGYTLVSTHGYSRLKGVTIAPVARDGKPDLCKKAYIPCDTLLVAAGLIPELEVCRGRFPGKNPGLFVCGNARYVHDLADHVTWEGMKVGAEAAAYVGKNVRMTREEPFLAEALGGKGNMICTVCPKGCVMQMETSPFAVWGNQCEKGVAFAKQEMENPQRMLTCAVKVENGVSQLVSARTNLPIAKDQIMEAMKVVKRLTVQAPVVVGQTIAEDVAGTGRRLVATCRVEESQK